MTNNKERRISMRKIATEFVNEVNSITFCKICGSQPIEWHHEEHPKKPNDRVSSLRTQGASIERIKLEMDRCEPLCRSCHMTIDGRRQALRESSPNQKGVVYVGPQSCSCCNRLAKPLRKGQCTGCYNHHSKLRIRKRNNGCGCDTIFGSKENNVTSKDEDR